MEKFAKPTTTEVGTSFLIKPIACWLQAHFFAARYLGISEEEQQRYFRPDTGRFI
jgi:hypothetical protein